MAKKNKELDFLYKSEDNKKNKSKNKVIKNKKRAGNKPAPNEKFDFDNEIVIGVTIPEETKKRKVKKQVEKKNSKTKSKNTTKTTKQKMDKQIKNKKAKSKKQIKEKKDRFFLKAFIKWSVLIVALIASIIFFLMSPLFDVSEIQVLNNEKISSDTITSLSKIEIGQNIYKTTKMKVKKNIKENAYIEDVTIKRKLPNKIEISVKERKATYMLEYANSYVYINNQGYILEISEEKLDIPIISGYTTSEEKIKEGARLCENDLERIQIVLGIMETANSNGIGNKITRISIENKQNYILKMEEAKKTVYLGDATNLSNKMLYLKAILIDEEGVEGEIFINMDLNKEKAFFRKKE